MSIASLCIRCTLWILPIAAGAVACRSREGDVPLRATNAPACKPGATGTKSVLVRIERGSDFVQQDLGAQMFAANTWAGRSATIKVALCPQGAACPQGPWIRSIETTVRGDDRGLEIDLPKFELPCSDGTVASN